MYLKYLKQKKCALWLFTVSVGKYSPSMYHIYLQDKPSDYYKQMIREK